MRWIRTPSMRSGPGVEVMTTTWWPAFWRCWARSWTCISMPPRRGHVAVRDQADLQRRSTAARLGFGRSHANGIVITQRHSGLRRRMSQRPFTVAPGRPEREDGCGGRRRGEGDTGHLPPCQDRRMAHTLVTFHAHPDDESLLTAGRHGQGGRRRAPGGARGRHRRRGGRRRRRLPQRGRPRRPRVGPSPRARAVGRDPRRRTASCTSATATPDSGPESAARSLAAADAERRFVDVPIDEAAVAPGRRAPRGGRRRPHRVRPQRRLRPPRPRPRPRRRPPRRRARRHAGGARGDDQPRPDDHGASSWRPSLGYEVPDSFSPEHVRRLVPPGGGAHPRRRRQRLHRRQARLDGRARQPGDQRGRRHAQHGRCSCRSPTSTSRSPSAPSGSSIVAARPASTPTTSSPASRAHRAR